MKIIKILFITVLFVVLGSLLLDTLSLVVFGQSGHSAYNIPHYFSETYAVLDERYRNDTVLTNALALAPDDVSVGMTGGRWTISNDMTVAVGSHLFFDCDTTLYLATTNVTLTVNGSLDSAGHCLMIDGFGTVTGNILNVCIDPEWLGDNIVNGLDVPYCDEYATTNWVIWYVGDHFTNSIQPWVTNWVIDYVEYPTNHASLVTNNVFLPGVTNTMETLIVLSNMTVSGYDYTDFVSQKIFYGYSTNVITVAGPVTYMDSWHSELYDPYDAFNLTNGVFTPPKEGYYLLFGNVVVTLDGVAEYGIDLFFDIDRVGSSKIFGYSSHRDGSNQAGAYYGNIYYLYTTNEVELAVYEEDASPKTAVRMFYQALYLGVQP